MSAVLLCRLRGSIRADLMCSVLNIYFYLNDSRQN